MNTFSQIFEKLYGPERPRDEAIAPCKRYKLQRFLNRLLRAISSREFGVSHS